MWRTRFSARHAAQLEQRERDHFVALALRATSSLVQLAADCSPAEHTLARMKEEFADGAPRSVASQLAHLDGVLSALRGERGAAVEAYGRALAPARSLGYLPWVAEILVDYATSLVADDRRDEAAPLLAEGRALAEPVGWKRLLDRIEALETGSTREQVLTS